LKSTGLDGFSAVTFTNISSPIGFLLPLDIARPEGRGTEEGGGVRLLNLFFV
jgi:hypothetical protein